MLLCAAAPACGWTDRNERDDRANDGATSTSTEDSSAGGATSSGGSGGTFGGAGGSSADATSVGGSTAGWGGNGGSSNGGSGNGGSGNGGNSNGGNSNGGNSNGGNSNGGNSNGGSGNGGSGNGGSGESTTGGSGGGGPDGPVTSVPLAGGETEKVDLLFVIDNSISMADKQELFQTAVPTLVERLINPVCVSLTDAGEVAIVATPNTPCPSGYEREFKPLTDVHVGLISSSLGGHGGDYCSPLSLASWNETQNDRARLLPSVRPEAELASHQGLGFLAWDPEGVKDPPGEAEVGALVDAFQAHVAAAGEVGCGYEAPLEAWYRFLVDPAPPLDIMVEDNIARPATDETGTVLVDEVVLAQRAAFLRPHSVVGIIMLTDENDCSVVDSGIGWLTASARVNGSNFIMPPATTTCDTDPNDPCCRSCGIAGSVAGCPDLGSDANCQTGRPADTDAINLRCYNQKQRFGFDLLHPVERYIDALTEPTLGGGIPNPLFVQGNNIRSPSRVVLTGIVGVPWQDLATPESLAGSGLEYMTPEELVANDRWQVILGDPDERVAPTDPLMIETPEPRSGIHPLTGEAVAPETSTDPSENSINGHEIVNAANNDLQYACIFPLQTPRDCSDPAAACDCTYDDLQYNRPLCNPPEGGAAGTTQYFGKAYPATRLLQVIQGLGPRGMPASICPRTTSGSSADPSFGYNPAVDAIVRRVEAGLGASCVGELAADVSSTLACRVIEIGRSGCDCESLGRRAIPAEIADAVESQLMALCAARGDDCGGYCACEIEPLTSEALSECTTEVEPAFGDGWCYISPSQGVGSEALVEHCPVGQQRTVRVIGAATELAGTELRLFCH